jgi:hypothetical protein
MKPVDCLKHGAYVEIWNSPTTMSLFCENFVILFFHAIHTYIVIPIKAVRVIFVLCRVL